jgi:hypothetical protein
MSLKIHVDAHLTSHIVGRIFFQIGLKKNYVRRECKYVVDEPESMVKRSERFCRVSLVPRFRV